MGQYATKPFVPARNILILTVGGDATVRSLDILSRRAPLYETLKSVTLTGLVPDLYDTVDAAAPGTFLAFVGIDQNLDTVSVVQDNATLTPSMLLQLLGALTRERFWVQDVTEFAVDRDLEWAFGD